MREIDELVCLPPEVVRDHRRLRLDRAYDGDPDAAALHRLDQGAEISVTGEKHHVVDMGASSSASIASSMSMLPLTFRRPIESTNSFAGLVTTRKPL